MRKMEDLSGKKYNRLTVLNFHHKDTNFRSYWNCLCECGQETVVRSDCLKSGNTKACGCLSLELSEQRLLSYITKHSGHGTRLYSIWVHMRDRCRRKIKTYSDVSVCEKWENDFLNFKFWAEKNGYSDDLTIDRINPYGNYEPDNCRWITIKEQQKNRRNTVKIDGIPLTIVAENCGINYHTLYQRIKKLGWSEQDTINKSLRTHEPYRHGGKKL